MPKKKDKGTSTSVYVKAQIHEILEERDCDNEDEAIEWVKRQAKEYKQDLSFDMIRVEEFTKEMYCTEQGEVGKVR